jgi:hypothetical protein
LSLLVDQFREISSTDLTQICNAQNKANSIKNVRLS